MTKHRDVNKCRRKDNCKIAALIRQANKRVRNGQQKKKELMVGKEKEKKRGTTNKTKTNKKHHFLKRKEARNVSEQRDKGWIHVIRVHDTIH